MEARDGIECAPPARMVARFRMAQNALYPRPYPAFSVTAVRVVVSVSYMKLRRRARV
jgi:hypothetical protein